MFVSQFSGFVSWDDEERIGDTPRFDPFVSVLRAQHLSLSLNEGRAVASRGTHDSWGLLSILFRGAAPWRSNLCLNRDNDVASIPIAVAFFPCRIM